MVNGRPKKKPKITIAFNIECSGEHCNLCRFLKKDGYNIVCLMFRRELLVTKAIERCSDCHMAERLANGEDIEY